MKQTQAGRILEVLRGAKGEWVNGRVFIQDMMISQAHARIFELERRGHRIEASPFKDEFGFRSYRLVEEAEAGPCCASYGIFKVHARDCAINQTQKHGDTLFAEADGGA